AGNRLRLYAGGDVVSLLIKGVTKLSELVIDANKDWAIKGIDSLSYVIIEDGADHYMRLPSLTTAQRDGLAAAVGMTIWNSDNTQIEKYDGSDWGAMGMSGVSVRKNTQMPVVGSRPQLNFMEGADIDIQVADNPSDDEIDISISAKYPTRFKTFIPSDAVLPGADMPALATVTGTNFAYDVLDFDPTSEEFCYWDSFLTPDYLSENIVVDIFWISAAAAGDVVFGMSVLGRENGEAFDAALGVERTVTTPTGGAGVLNISRIATFSPNWSPKDNIVFKLARKAADGADTIDANDVRVLKAIVSYTAEFSQAFYPLAEPIELTLTASDAWTDMDVSAHIPAGATGVILHIEHRRVSVDNFGLRKKGSTDNRINNMWDESHMWAMIGVDEARQFQYYAGFHSEMDIYLVGYTATGVIFFDNAVQKVPGGFGAWTDVDVSAECPNAIGVIIELVDASAGGKACCVRKNGSTLETKWGITRSHAWAITGVDGAQKYEAWGTDASATFYVVGYITEGAVFPANGVDKTPGNVNVWETVDCSVQAPSAVMLFFLSMQ
ncbi:hypothetical protein LCGC14_2358950, partial [marine sediment metagenome]